MNLRFALFVVLALFCAQSKLTATTTYDFGSTNNISFASSPNPYVKGSWTESFSGGSGTTQQIDCVVALASIGHICGNPGPGSSVNIGIPAAPGNTAILPVGTTNYLVVDGDPTWGAPVWTNMTGLTVGVVYQVSFYQSSSEENGNNKAYNDNWKVYLIPGASSGVYICPVCSSPVDPIPGNLAYTSTVMANSGAVSTNWGHETFTFTATNTSEILEFVTNAIAVTAGAWQPPFLNLAAVSVSAQTPEPGTGTLILLGAGVVFAGRWLRRPSSTRK